MPENPEARNLAPRSMREPWVIVSAGFHFRGGQAKAVAALADYLARGSHPVHLVGHEFDSHLATTSNVVLHRVSRPLHTDAFGNVLLARVGRAVARRLKAQDPATRIVVNGGNCDGGDINWVHYLHAAFAPKLENAPRWFRLKEWAVGAWHRRREARAIRSAQLVLTNSQRTTADVVRRLGVPQSRVRTVYYGADPAWSPPSPDERVRTRYAFELDALRPVVAFVGGFGYDNRKGFDTLLRAWEIVCRDPDWDMDLVLVGGGKAAGAVARLLDRRGLSSRVRMLGFTDRVFDLLAAVDLLVSPVRYEPYGLNVQEAIGRGVPAIVSAVAGVAEEYPPKLSDAILSDPDEPAELAAKLRAWHADREGWRERFRPLSERLRSRTWDDMAREIVAFAECTRKEKEAL
jgi:glycosyltransferase involved in cell wall biosynthesis